MPQALKLLTLIRFEKLIILIMNLFKQSGKLVRSGMAFDQYYKNLNYALKRYNDEFIMLHYPYFNAESDSLFQGQKNLTDYCISLVEPLENKNLLEIGCGNGIQCMYIKEKCNPQMITGVDLDPSNIEIANSEKERRQLTNIEFHQGDAQTLTMIKDNSVDVVFNIESALHYPDKQAFLKQIYRVLKPGGRFVITDILTTKGKGTGIRKFWKKKMKINNWPKNLYESGFSVANLKIDYEEDITQNVIKAFRNYPSWFKKMKKINFLNDLLFKFYYKVYLTWTLYVLNKRRLYYVFSGSRLL
jgi:ubiquinone/menaquinone biosynthesis C-methylase UbiE